MREYRRWPASSRDRSTKQSLQGCGRRMVPDPPPQPKRFSRLWIASGSPDCCSFGLKRAMHDVTVRVLGPSEVPWPAVYPSWDVEVHPPPVLLGPSVGDRALVLEESDGLGE